MRILIVEDERLLAETLADILTQAHYIVDVEIITIVEDSGEKKATMAYTPTTTPSVVYAINKDKSLGDPIEVGTADENAKITGNVITLPDTI